MGEPEIAGLPRGDGGLVWDEAALLMRGRDCWRWRGGEGKGVGRS